MKKITFNKTEVKNLYEMLRSKDQDNHVIALSGLQQIDIKKNIGELILLYKYSTLEKNASTPFQVIHQ